MGVLNGTSGSFQKTNASHGNGYLRLAQPSDTSPEFSQHMFLETLCNEMLYKTRRVLWLSLRMLPMPSSVHTCSFPQLPYLNKYHHFPSCLSQKSNLYLWFLSLIPESQSACSPVGSSSKMAQNWSISVSALPPWSKPLSSRGPQKPLSWVLPSVLAPP